MQVWIYEAIDGRFNRELTAESVELIPDSYKTAQFVAFEAQTEKRPYGMKAVFTPADPEPEPPVEAHWDLEDDAGFDTLAKASLLAQMRLVRNALLAGADFTQLPDAPISVETKALWVTYRQDLRDMPEEQSVDTVCSASDWVWPTVPS